MNWLLSTLLVFSITGANKKKCEFPLFIKDHIIILNPDRLDKQDKMALATAKYTCEIRIKRCTSVIKMVTNKDKSRDYIFYCEGKEL